MRKVFVLSIILWLTAMFGVLAGVVPYARAGGLADSAWPCEGHDARHTGQSQYVGAQTNDLKWIYETGDDVYSSPAIGVDGTLYFGSLNSMVYALNPDGSLKWSFRTGGGVYSSPAVGADGMVYVGSLDTKVYAFNPDGSLKWSYQTGGDVVSSPALGQDGTVYIGSYDWESWNGKVYALRADGSLKWVYQTGAWVSSSPAIGTDGTVYIGSLDGKLYALRSDGSLKWSYQTGDGISSSPSIGADGTVYVGSYDCKVYALRSDGSLKWSYQTGDWVESIPAIGDDGTVYVGCDDNKIYAFNTDGSMKWSYQTGKAVSSSPAIGADGTVYIGCYDYAVYALNPDGSLKWSYQTSACVYSSPSIGADGTVYVVSADGKVYAFGIANTETCDAKDNDDDGQIDEDITPRISFDCQGTEVCQNGQWICNAIPPAKEDDLLADSAWPCKGHDARHTGQSPYVGAQTNDLKWSYQTGGYVRSSAAIGADGTVYFGSDDSKVYALNPNGSLKWDYQTGAQIFSTPAIGVDGTVYVGSDDSKVYALNPNGSLKWSYHTDGDVDSSPAIGSDGTVYVGSDDSKVYALNPNGSLKWIYQTGGYVRSSAAIGADGTVYIGSYDNKVYALNPNGSLKWSYQTWGWVESSPGIGLDGTVFYVGSDDGKVYAINQDGYLKWSYQTTGSSVFSSPAIGADGTVYVGSYDGKVYAINHNGRLKWSYGTNGYVDSSPAIGADGTVYIGSSDAHVYALNPDGSLKWSYQTGDVVIASPAIGADGTVYVGSEDGKIYAFGLPNPETCDGRDNNDDGQIDEGINPRPCSNGQGTEVCQNGQWICNTTSVTGSKGWSAGIDPFVYASDPQPNQMNVAVSEVITIIFTSPMDPITTADAFYFYAEGTGESGNLKGKGTLKIEDAVLTFVPSSDLQPGTTYWVKVKSTATDINGNYLDGDFNGVGGEEGEDDWKVMFTTATQNFQPPSSTGGNWSEVYDQMNGGLMGKVSCLAVESRDLLWVVTKEENHIYCFDGHTWENKTPFVSRFQISGFPCMAIDNQDRVWVGLDTCLSSDPDAPRLAKWENNTWQTISARTLNLAQYEVLIKIAADSLGNLWMVTSGGQVLTYCNGQVVSHPIYELSAGDITSLVIDRENNVWVGTTFFGVYKLVSGGDDWQDYLYVIPSFRVRALGIVNYIITDMAADSYGNIWVGTNDGLLKLNPFDGSYGGLWIHYILPDSNQGLSQKGQSVTALAVGPNSGTVWVGTQAGLKRFDGDNEWTVFGGENGNNLELSGQSINALAINSRGEAWIGTEYGLVMRSVTLNTGAYGTASSTSPCGGVSGSECMIIPDGSLKWSYQTGNWINSTPAIGTDGTIYIGNYDNKVYALNPNGSLKWSYQTGGYVYSSPAIGADGTVYVGSDDEKVYALRLDGSLKWSYQTGNSIESTPAIGADGTVYVGSHDNKVYALNPNGSLKWSYQTREPVWSSPAIEADDTVYVGSNDGKVYALRPDGSLKWSYQTEGQVWSTAAIGIDGTIYIGSDDGKVYALKPDGSLKWSYQTGNRVKSTPAIGTDGTVYVGSNDGKVYALNPNGSLKWSYQTEDDIYSSPAIGSDGTVYIGSDDHKVYAINPNGSLKWSYETGKRVVSSPTIGADGTVYVGSGDGKVYAFGMANPEICDGKDNDGDGQVDEDLTSRPCATVCGTGQETCRMASGLDAAHRSHKPKSATDGIITAMARLTKI